MLQGLQIHALPTSLATFAGNLQIAVHQLSQNVASGFVKVLITSEYL